VWPPKSPNSPDDVWPPITPISAPDLPPDFARVEVLFGTITLKARVDDQEPQGREIMFDPVPRVDCIDPSGDPLTEVRTFFWSAGVEAGGEREMNPAAKASGQGVHHKQPGGR
jgi:hypothetical protein